MKKQILKKLNQIAKIAIATGIQGKISLNFTGCTVKEFDEAVESISEFPRWKHFVDVAPKLTVTLLID
jgi:hypothetical protein